MICPHCGKEMEQSFIVSSPTKDMYLNLNAGYILRYTPAITTNAQSFVPYAVSSLNNACAGAGVMQPVHYVQL